MRLQLVRICGFRSIEDMRIPFEGTGYKILVGKNESGKSNILSALHLLSGKAPFKEKDRKESYNGNAFVVFRFELEDDEIAKCKIKFTEKFPAGLGAKLAEGHTVKSFFEAYAKHISYAVRCGENGYWTLGQLDKSLEIQAGWHSVSNDIVNHGLHEKIPPGSYISDNYIEKEFHENDQVIIRNCLVPVNLADVYKVLRQQVLEIITPEHYTFPIRYWQYAAQEHDLPPTINRETFSQRPDSCIPLKNMFLLANIQENEIRNKISEAHALSSNSLRNLLHRVNRATNAYIEKSWQEYSNVKIELWSDGENIVIGIKDSDSTNLFNFEQRSDGFRRLVSFLLLISIEFDTKQYADTPLILIDEPETGLHPSSAKDLKYKLIELGNKTTIVYATHSISMIDTENIRSNLVVKKKDENTTIEEGKEDGISPAEILYQAIGYSVFEEIKKKNILLEGYTDKRPLRLFTKGPDWKDIGLCYTRGAKNIRCVVSMLDLISREYFVLSDGDADAKQRKQDMENPQYWYTYEDLGSAAITIEDFYDKAFFMGIVKKILKRDGIEMPDSVLSEDNDRMKSIKRFLEQEAKEKNVVDAAGMVKRINREIKLECATSVTRGKVMQDKITEMLNALLQRIDDSQNSG